MAVREIIERCRRQQQQKPGQLEMLSEREEQLMAVNRDMTNFMQMIACDCPHPDYCAGMGECESPWATEAEALEEWRSRTLEDWGFGRWYDEDVAVV